MTWRWTCLLAIMMLAFPVNADVFVSSTDTGYVPPVVIFIHGMAADPASWEITASHMQSLVQAGSIDAPSITFKYKLPPVAITSVQAKADPSSWSEADIRIDSSYFQYVHFGLLGNLNGIPSIPGDEFSEPIADPAKAITEVAVRDFPTDQLQSVLEAVNDALRLQASIGVAPANRSVIIVAHSTGGLATRVFLMNLRVPSSQSLFSLIGGEFQSQT